MAARFQRVESNMPYVPYAPSRVDTVEDAIRELLAPCGRFKNPLSSDERMRARMTEEITRSGTFAKSSFVVRDATPLNWQALLTYLHERKFTGTSRLSFSSIRTDLPHLYTIRLEEHPEASPTGGRAVSRYGFASTASAEESISRAIGELLERYMLGTFVRSDLYRASFGEAKRRRRRVLDIFSLNEFLPSQRERFPQFERSDEKIVSWVEGERYFDHARTLIPAQLVFWSYRPEREEMLLAQSDTNGCAGHFTKDEAVLSGLLELIQRDAFLIYWLNGLSPKRIDPSTFVDQEIKDLLAYLRRYKLEYHFLNTTSDVGVPSCTCVLIDRERGEPVIGVGGGTGFSLREIIVQSVGEALAIVRSVESKPAIRLPKDYKPFRDPQIGRDARLSIWRGQEAMERFSFFLRGRPQSFEAFMGEVIWHRTPAQRLAYIERRLRELGEGYETYVYEAKHEVLKTLGYHAVRVVVPRLMHLYLTEHLATLGAPRLREVPVKLGYAAAAEYTPWPHPFP